MIIGILPAAFSGFILSNQIGILFNIQFVSVMLIITGISLFKTKGLNPTGYISFRFAFIIGLFQAFTLLPGISRSGITIAVALLIGLNRKDAAQFSFYMAIPLLIGAMILQIPELINVNPQTLNQLFLGFIASFVTGYVIIKLLINLISKNHFWKFSIYCWTLSVAIHFVI